MITLGDAHHATRLLLQARRRSDAFTAVPSALPPFRPSPCRPRLVVFLSSPSIQFDHGRFSEMRSQMGNATPAGQRDRVTHSVSWSSRAAAAAGGVDGFRGKINRWCSLESDFCSPAKAVKVCRVRKRVPWTPAAAGGSSPDNSVVARAVPACTSTFDEGKAVDGTCQTLFHCRSQPVIRRAAA